MVFRLRSSLIQLFAHTGVVRRGHRYRPWRYGLLPLLGAIAALLMGVISPGMATDTVEIPPGTAPETLLQQGQGRYEQGYLAEAAQLWEAAQQRYRRNNNLIGEIQAANYLTLTWQNLGRLTEADELNQTVLAQLEMVLQSNPDPAARSLQGLRAQALNHRGHLLSGMGQLEQATDIWHDAQLAYEDLNDTTGAIGSIVAQARALQSLGHHHKGQGLLETAALALEETPDSQLKAIAFRGLGEAFQIVGELDQAHLALRASRETADAIHSPDDAAAAWIDIGHLARRQRYEEKALEYYRYAANSAISPGVKLRGRLNELQTLIPLDAAVAARKVGPLIRELNGLPLNQDSLYGRINLADSWIRLDAQRSPVPPGLPQFLGTTVHLAQTLGNPRAEVFGRYHLSRLYENHGQLTEAKQLSEQALNQAQAIGANDIAARIALQLGTVQGKQGDREGAIAAYGQAIQFFRYLRQDLVAIGTDVQFDFRETVEPAYRRLIGLLLQPGASTDEIAQARDVIEALQVAELDNFFGDSCLTTLPKSIETLDPKAAVLYPIFLDDRLDMIVALGDRPLEHFTVDAPREQLEQTLELFYSSLNPAYGIQEQQRLGKILYGWLIAPIQEDLKAAAIDTLVMVPDGPLRRVPMGALYDGDRYLVEQYQVAISPGLQLLPPDRKDSRSTIFAAGLSKSRQGYNALPGVTAELNNISQDFETQLLVDEAFTVDEFLHQLDSKSFPIVHLATHGQFSSSSEDTYLLAWNKRLYVHNFDQLFRKRQVGILAPIDLLVMSACQTAKGDDRATLGLAGFALRSGARSTVASLWSVNDESTAALMTEFYKSLAMDAAGDRTNPRKAESLRLAQLRLLQSDRYQHPYYWAAFILIGNWQ